jgi:hypothetical protein
MNKAKPQDREVREKQIAFISCLPYLKPLGEKVAAMLADRLKLDKNFFNGLCSHD